MTTLVYVVNHNGNPLMPCQPSKARKLLRDRRAKVVKRSPFTIQLLWDCEEHVQEVVVGIDKGHFVKQINSIYSNGYLAFRRVKGEPFQALPRDCQLLERGQTILWEKVS